MSENAIKVYFDLLANKIANMFGVTREQATAAIQRSAIQKLIREDPEYVDHVPLSDWAEEIYGEMFA